MLNITNLREIQIKTTISPYFLPIRIATIKNTEYNQCWWECRKIAILMYYWFHSVAQLSPTLCNPMDCSMSGLPVHHQLLELAQIHAHWVGDVNHIILCCPLFLLPSLFPSISHFQWVSSFYQVAKVLEFQLQHQSLQGIHRTHFLLEWLAWSPCSPRDSHMYSSTPQFKSINSSVLSFLYGPILTSIHDYWKNHSFD